MLVCCCTSGVKSARVSLLAQKAEISFEKTHITADDIVRQITDLGFGASLLDSHDNNHHSVLDVHVRRQTL